MKFDKKIYFIKGKKEYDRLTGDYSYSEQERVSRLADVTDTGLDKKQLLYGSVGVKAKTIRLKTPIDPDFDYLIYKDNKYQIKRVATYRQRQTIEAVALE